MMSKNRKSGHFFENFYLILSRDVPGQRSLSRDICSCPCPGTKGHLDKKIFLSRDKGTTGRPVSVCPVPQKHQFQPVLQSSQQGLRTYCPNIYTMLMGQKYRYAFYRAHASFSFWLLFYMRHAVYAINCKGVLKTISNLPKTNIFQWPQRMH